MRPTREFTLIEVMVVVAIIALLASILVPALKEARRQSKRSACLGNLEQIRIGMQSYLQVNHDTFPYVTTDPINEQSRADSDDPPRKPYPPLPIALKNEMAGKSHAFRCPADEIRNESTAHDPQVLARGWRTYFEAFGTSYEMWPWLWGKKLQPKTMSQILEEFKVPIKDVPMVYDIEIFHGLKDASDLKRLKVFNAMFVNFEVRATSARRSGRDEDSGSAVRGLNSLWRHPSQKSGPGQNRKSVSSCRTAPESC